jgi:hypothetical protein
LTFFYYLATHYGPLVLFGAAGLDILGVAILGILWLLDRLPGTQHDLDILNDALPDPPYPKALSPKWHGYYELVFIFTYVIGLVATIFVVGSVLGSVIFSDSFLRIQGTVLVAAIVSWGCTLYGLFSYHRIRPHLLRMSLNGQRKRAERRVAVNPTCPPRKTMRQLFRRRPPPAS